ncbi:MAG: DUF1156 domain-containing protein [Burkholderiales bacterium]|nr:DUF1156 domain-containing protein [Burkholderiales bacterium]
MPLDAVNAASAREQSIRHGHPSTLHWSERASASSVPSAFVPAAPRAFLRYRS